MKLSIFLPTCILVEKQVVSLNAKGPRGAFGLRPQHIDCVCPLIPGILSYRCELQEEPAYVAVDRGILVKQGAHVRVSVRHAVADAPLEQLATLVEEQFAVLDEHERKVKTMVAGLEADFLRRFMDL